MRSRKAAAVPREACGSSGSAKCWWARRWRSRLRCWRGRGWFSPGSLRVSQQDPGFKTDKLWIGVTVMSQAQYPDQASRARFAEQLQTALRATPGFEDLMLSSTFPLFGGPSVTLYTRPEGNVPPVAER